MIGDLRDWGPPTSPLHETGVLRALRHRFTVASNLPRVAEHLDRVLGRLSDSDGPAAQRYEVLDKGDGSLQVSVDGVHIAACGDLPEAVDWLMWHVNQSAAASVVGQVVLHAGGVRSGDLGILLPGRSGAGKSSVVAALVEAGLGYLSDELVVMGGDGETMVGYDRPVVLRPGAQNELPRWTAAGHDGFAPLAGGSLLVDPERVVPGCSGSPCAPAFVVAPRFVGGSGASLTPLTASQGLVELVGNSVRVGLPDPEQLHVLSRVARACRCYSLEFGDLGEASRVVVDLVA